MIDDDVKLGKNVRVFAPELVNLFGCEIGDGTFIGPFVEITRGTIVGRNCKIESHAFLCDRVTVEDDVFVGHGVMFTNDLYPRADSQVVRIPTLVRKGCSIGSNATIAPGVTLGEYAVIGAGAVVTRDVPAFAIVAGNPAQVLKAFATLSELNAYMRARQPLQGAE
jgi:UDP-2-acetamido-3-amino-2,3-dideoxy-glucuronate N-acetyltransferase